MDSLFNAGKQFLENQNQGNNNNQQQQGGNHQNQGGNSGGFDIGSIASLVSHGQQHDSNQDSGLMSSGWYQNSIHHSTPSALLPFRSNQGMPLFSLSRLLPQISTRQYVRRCR